MKREEKMKRFLLFVCLIATLLGTVACSMGTQSETQQIDNTSLGFSFSFHSLRHFAASFRSDLGIPRKYIEEVGRWESGSSVLDRVYDNTLESSRKKYTQMANTYIEDNFFKAKQA